MLRTQRDARKYTIPGIYYVSLKSGIPIPTNHAAVLSCSERKKTPQNSDHRGGIIRCRSRFGTTLLSKIYTLWENTPPSTPCPDNSLHRPGTNHHSSDRHRRKAVLRPERFDSLENIVPTERDKTYNLKNTSNRRSFSFPSRNRSFKSPRRRAPPCGRAKTLDSLCELQQACTDSIRQLTSKGQRINLFRRNDKIAEKVQNYNSGPSP